MARLSEDTHGAQGKGRVLPFFASQLSMPVRACVFNAEFKRSMIFLKICSDLCDSRRVAATQ